MAWLIVLNIFFAGVASVTITGRITYALARDNALPCSESIAYIEPYFQSPMMALIFAATIGIVLNILPLTDIGITAYYGIVGLATVGFQISYGIPIALKVYYDPPEFPLTPMSLGLFSYPLGVISSIWLFLSSILFFLPTSAPVTLANMNWLVAFFIIVFLYGALNWIFNSRYTFKGPKRYDSHRGESSGLLRGSDSEFD